MTTAAPCSARWSHEAVWERIQEAAEVLRRLPPSRTRPHGFRSIMPDVLSTSPERWERHLDEVRGVNWGDPWQLYRRAESRPATANALAISRADEVVGWVAEHPTTKERWAIWIVAQGLPKRRAAKHLRCNRATIYRWRDKGVERIVRGLNG